MKRLLLGFILALVAGAWLLQHIEDDSGYILIVLGQTSIEMSFWFAVAFVLSVLLVLWCVWRLITGSVKTAHVAVDHLFHGHKRRAQKRTARGLIDFMEGNWRQARRQLLKSAPKSDNPLINYLAASRSAYELGDEKEAFALLHRAEKSSESSSLAVALTQARMQLLNSKYEECVATLERARRKAPKHPVVLDLLRQVYIGLDDWSAVEELLPSLRKHKVSRRQCLDELEQRLYVEKIKASGKQSRKQLELESAEYIERQWKSLPSAVKRQSAMVLLYVQTLLQYSGEDIAEGVLYKTLRRDWDDELLLLYGSIESSDTQKQLLNAESWLKSRPGNANILLVLGRLCLRNKFWARARVYFEESVRLHQSGESCAELARLLANLNEHKESAKHYQQSVKLGCPPLADFPMPE